MHTQKIRILQERVRLVDLNNVLLIFGDEVPFEKTICSRIPFQMVFIDDTVLQLQNRFNCAQLKDYDSFVFVCWIFDLNVMLVKSK